MKPKTTKPEPYRPDTKATLTSLAILIGILVIMLILFH